MPLVAPYPSAIHWSVRRYRQRASNQPLRERLKRGIERSKEMSRSLTLESDFASAESELELAARLENDWDSYGAAAPSVEAIRRAGELLRDLRAKQFLPTTIVPSAEGGVAFYFISGDRTSYIEYRNSGEAILAMYAPVGEPEIRELRPGTDDFDSIKAVRSYLG